MIFSGDFASRDLPKTCYFIWQLWHQALDEDKTTVVLFIDFQKAFDSVSHAILMKKLSASGISGALHEYIQSYLENRKQYTVINQTKSENAKVEYGVPQGSLIGPDLFSLNVNDMPEQAQEDGELDLFADDSTAMETGDSIDEAMYKMINTAETVGNHASKNSLTIHPDKCKIMIISKKKFIGPLP